MKHPKFFILSVSCKCNTYTSMTLTEISTFMRGFSDYTLHHHHLKSSRILVISEIFVTIENVFFLFNIYNI